MIVVDASAIAELLLQTELGSRRRRHLLNPGLLIESPLRTLKANQHLHSSLGYQSPVDYERRAA